MTTRNTNPEEATMTTETATIAPETYDIPTENMADLEAKIAKLARRARKLEVPAPELVEVARYTHRWTEEVHLPGYGVRKVERARDYVQVRVAGAAPRLPGWDFLGTVEHHGSAGNILRVVPTAAVAEGELDGFRFTDARRCDHCKAARRRKDTFLVRHDDGAVYQVGRTCLRDFTGHKSPEAIASMAELLLDAVSACMGDEEGGGGFRLGPPDLALSAFLAYVVRAIRAHGWASRSAAREGGAEATADVALWASRPLHGSEARYEPARKAHADLQPTADDWARAKDLLRAALPALVGATSDYERNLQVVIATGYVGAKQAGIAASIARYAERILGDAERRRRDAAAAERSDWVGTEGKRADFELTLVKTADWEGRYGWTYLYAFEDATGNQVVWFASRCQELDVGSTYKVRGTVKRHGERQGVRQTVLTRCKVS